jgi:SAM-dependent methyltransferase
MIESQNPDLDLAELNRKVDQALLKQTPVTGDRPTEPSPGTAADLAKLDNLEALVADANFNAQGPQQWPSRLDRFPFVLAKRGSGVALRLYRFLFKKQTVVNRAFGQSLQEIIGLLRAQRYADQNSQSRLEALIQQAEEAAAARDQLAAALGAQTQTVQDLQRQLGQLTARLDGVAFALEQGLGPQVQSLAERLPAVEQQLQQQLLPLGEQQQGLHRLQELYLQSDRYYKEALTQQQRLLTLLLEQSGSGGTPPPGQAAAIARSTPGPLPESLPSTASPWQAEVGAHLLDPFYAAFEDQFRGERAEIRRRLQVYLPLLERQQLRSLGLPAIDLGCGRGEWLALLGDEGYRPQGVDLNRTMVDRCRSRGLAVAEQEAIAYLRAQPEGSACLVTGFHIIEHLPLASLIQLLQESHRVLAPGGMALFETPNPQNFMVGACNFYADPTHLNPIFPPSAQFMMNQVGFARPELMFVNPVEQTPFDHRPEPEWQVLRTWFYGPRDYSVLGYKE